MPANSENAPSPLVYTVDGMLKDKKFNRLLRTFRLAAKRNPRTFKDLKADLLKGWRPSFYVPFIYTNLELLECIRASQPQALRARAYLRLNLVALAYSIFRNCWAISFIMISSFKDQHRGVYHGLNMMIGLSLVLAWLSLEAKVIRVEQVYLPMDQYTLEVLETLWDIVCDTPSTSNAVLIDAEPSICLVYTKLKVNDMQEHHPSELLLHVGPLEEDRV